MALCSRPQTWAWPRRSLNEGVYLRKRVNRQIELLRRKRPLQSRERGRRELARGLRGSRVERNQASSAPDFENRLEEKRERFVDELAAAHAKLVCKRVDGVATARGNGCFKPHEKDVGPSDLRYK